MKISVITVCYNAANTIERTIESVVSQTAFKNIEYIIIDGNSTDGTIDIIKKHSDKITNFVSEKDTGIYNAMNKGIKLATADYIHFLNANDFYYSENVVEEVLKTALQYQTDFVIGDVVLITAQKDKLYRSNKNINAYSLFTDWLYHVTLFAKKSLFTKYGLFDESYKIASDNNWILPLLLNKNITKAYVEKTIAQFGLDGISAQESTKQQTLEELEKILVKNFKGKNDFFRRILQDKAFNQFSSAPIKFLNKMVRKLRLKKTFAKLVTKNSYWQINYQNRN